MLYKFVIKWINSLPLFSALSASSCLPRWDCKVDKDILAPMWEGAISTTCLYAASAPSRSPSEFKQSASRNHTAAYM